MSNSGAVTLGDIAGKLAMLEVACFRCDRPGSVALSIKWVER
jgi:hypothetical protein